MLNVARNPITNFSRIRVFPKAEQSARQHLFITSSHQLVACHHIYLPLAAVVPCPSLIDFHAN
ncbi:hypothetical protein TSUD_180590 [Trifolium subterraneum]|uniref:Uncharacterized protein n=1 Tax=Trifolium subterraneum TaxID=3900 RepID=A0A2Z6MFL9_TRISU|nr:hypothetical protein TSUD_180590 [Trifolium subterraneum]